MKFIYPGFSEEIPLFRLTFLEREGGIFAAAEEIFRSANVATRRKCGF
jgi:hypothetical protein